MRKATLTTLVAVSLLPLSFMAGHGIGEASAWAEIDRQRANYVSSVQDAPYPELRATAIMEGINKARTDHGLAPLSTSQQLNTAACAKADHMLAGNYWSHVAPDGTTPWYFFDAVGYGYYRAGENLAYGQVSDSQVVSEWMASSGHKANILGNYTEQGLCVKYGPYQGDKEAVIVNHFGTPL